MKKLFTLIALMAVFMSAKAIHIVDAKVDYSEQTEVKFYSWGSESAKARLSIQDGCLHFHSDEATDPGWDCQFAPIGADNVEVGVTYTLKLKMKGDHAQNISAVSFGGSENWGNLAVPTDWTEIEITYEATKTEGQVLIQCGDYVGDWDIAWMEISHEGVEERPVQWAELLTNGNAEQTWEELGLADVKSGDNENNYKVCIWAKERDNHLAEDGGFDTFPAHIIAEPGNESNHVFWVETPAATTEGDAAAWDSQIWFESPREWKTGEQFKLSFRYKADVPVTVASQVHHQDPGNYLFWQAIGDISFTTEWQTFEKEVTVAADANGMWSIAFNLNQNNKEPMNFYIDDLSWSEMVLEHGLFVASTNTETGLVDYNYDNATEFVWDDGEGAWAATVGTAGKEESWVNEVQISTVRGNRRQFLANTIKAKSPVDGDPGNWIDFEPAGSAKIKLPAQGVWNILVDTDALVMAFELVEGTQIVAPVEIVPNPTVNVIEGQERDWKPAKEDGTPQDGEEGIGNGQPWDNQFWIFANRTIAANEEVVIEFDYIADKEAKTTTQIHGLVDNATAYLHWSAIGDVNFTTEEQHFSTTIKWPADGAKTSTDDGGTVTNHGIAFNMAEIKDACTYTIKNVIFKLSDDSESLIDMEGDKNFWFKVGAGTAPYSSGINNVVNNKVANNAIYNIAGQRVSENYKGIVVKNGVKYLNK